MTRRYGIAIVCAIALVVLGGGALALRSVGTAADPTTTSAAVVEESGNDSVLPARRGAAHGSSVPLLVALAVVGVAGVAVPGAAIRGRRPCDGAWAPSLLRVPCGTRAPPLQRVA